MTNINPLMPNDCCLYRRFYSLEILDTSSNIAFISFLSFSE
jgi:hypothetical protein